MSIYDRLNKIYDLFDKIIPIKKNLFLLPILEQSIPLTDELMASVGKGKHIPIHIAVLLDKIHNSFRKIKDIEERKIAFPIMKQFMLLSKELVVLREKEKIRL